MNDSLLLISNFLRNPKEVGALVPSSKFLTREIVGNIEFNTSKNIVELGPGLGTITKEILKKSDSNTKVICFEVNKKFFNYLNENIKDGRVTFINDGAEKLKKYLKKIKMKRVDCIVSGLPFLNFKHSKKEQILKAVQESLSNDGKFILFQYTNELGAMLRSYFSKVTRKFVALNIPPSFVYLCEK